jgi:hypothetical protein
MTRKTFIERYCPSGYPLAPRFIEDFYKLLNNERTKMLLECEQIVNETLKKAKQNEQAQAQQTSI